MIETMLCYKVEHPAWVLTVHQIIALLHFIMQLHSAFITFKFHFHSVVRNLFVLLKSWVLLFRLKIIKI